MKQLNCYRVVLSTTNAMSNSACHRDGHIRVTKTQTHSRAGELFVHADDASEVANEFPNALAIEYFGKGYVIPKDEE